MKSTTQRRRKLACAIASALILFLASITQAQSVEYAGYLTDNFGAFVYDGPTGREFGSVAFANATEYVDVTESNTATGWFATINQAVHQMTQPATTTWTKMLAVPGSASVPVTASVTINPTETSLVTADGPFLLFPGNGDPNSPDFNSALPDTETYSPLTISGSWTIDTPDQHLSGTFTSVYNQSPTVETFYPYWGFAGQNFPNGELRSNDELNFYYGSPVYPPAYQTLFSGIIDGQPWALTLDSPAFFTEFIGGEPTGFTQLPRVPEPSSIALLAIGAITLAIAGCRRRRAVAPGP